jgi:hypothetical protein
MCFALQASDGLTICGGLLLLPMRPATALDKWIQSEQVQLLTRLWGGGGGDCTQSSRTHEIVLL